VLEPDTGDILSRRAASVTRINDQLHRPSVPATAMATYGDVDVTLAADHQLRGIRRDGTDLWNTRIQHRLRTIAMLPLVSWVATTATLLGEDGDVRHVATLVDPADGALLWTRPLPWEPVAFAATPDEHVLVTVLRGTFGKTVVVALDPPSGAVAWEHSLSVPTGLVLTTTDDRIVLDATDEIVGCG
jgi:outer membrane protein assembly factor BamB